MLAYCDDSAEDCRQLTTRSVRWLAVSASSCHSPGRSLETRSQTLCGKKEIWNRRLRPIVHVLVAPLCAFLVSCCLGFTAQWIRIG